VLVEKAEDTTVEEIKKNTGAPFVVHPQLTNIKYAE
jgi:acyl CoA:acetate/3-ketoacid CoA transferase beta subunit